MSQRYKGAIISATPPTTSTSSASGEWTLAQQMQAQGASAWPVANPDPYFNQVSLLLHGDGTNGGQNNTFLDSSTNNFTITRNGNTTQGTFSPFSLAEGQWSNYFDGNGDYLTAPSGTAFDFGTGDWTVEGWQYFTGIPTPDSGGTRAHTLFSVASAAVGTYGFAMTLSVDASGNGTSFGIGKNTNTSQNITASVSTTMNTWYHFAACKSGNNVYLFVNGTQVGTTTTSTTAWGNSTDIPKVGRLWNSNYMYEMVGYISNLRVVKGTAVYTANFTTPTAPLTAITNTSLLTCQSNRFVDNSANNFTITPSGDTKVTAWSPFIPALTPYSTSTNGGSVYFDGSGDTLTYSNPAWGTGNWTVEFFVYSTNNGGWPHWLDTRGGTTNGQAFYYSGGYLRTSRTDFLVALPPTNSWEHIAFCKSGSTQYCYVNGVLQQTKTDTYSYDAGTGTIGGDCFGYVSNLRIVVGTAVYTSNFTPPTAPLTAVANTQLLLNCTNAGIFDNAGKNDIETVGNAQISTSVKKYGTGSMYFDGTGDYLQLPTSTYLDFGTGDFTVEAWVNTTNLSEQNTIIDMRTANVGGANLFSAVKTTGVLFVHVNNADRITSSPGAITTNTWYHVAISRSSGNTRMFINGVQAGSTWGDTTTYGANNTRIGRSWWTSYPEHFNGYIDDFRITKGVARYTANFVPPIQAFPTIDMSKKYPGGYLTKTPPTVSQTSAQGIWTLEQAEYYQQSGQWPVAPDPYFNQVSLLLHGDGTNGAQNNTFLDSSTNNFTITRTGNVAQGTFSPFSLAEGQWSNYFDGSGDYLTIPYSTTAFDWWTSDFTIEAWVYPTTLTGWVNSGTTPSLVGNMDPNGNINYWSFGPYTGNTVRFYYWNGSGNAVTSTATINLNQWNHIAMTKTSSGITLWVNGVGNTPTVISGTPQSSASYTLTVGQYNSTSINGYVSNVRVVKGTALYTANFTPPTSALTAISGTSLLTCQSNRFVDNSSNNFTITRNGDTKVTAFSPFAPSAAYSASTNGGSAYFDGSGDYLTAPANTSAFQFGTGDFCAECFYYYIPGNGYNTFFNNGFVSGYVIRSSAGTPNLYTNGAQQVTSSVDCQAYAWNHVVFCRVGSTLSIFLNGVRTATATYSSSIPGAYAVDIGYDGQYYALGYISNSRIVKGSSPYDATQSTCTVPTAPLTAVTNTQLLLNCTNAGIIDNAIKNDIETVGDAQISTSVKKYGTGSMYFDGSGDYLFTTDKPEMQLGADDFTIESWVYATTNSGNPTIYACGNGSNANGLIAYPSTAMSFLINNVIIITDTIPLPTNQWVHFAATRKGTTVRLFRNGVVVGTATNSSTLTSGGTFIGIWANGSSFLLNGYIDDLRITKGVARYTANFVPPNGPFPNV